MRTTATSFWDRKTIRGSIDRILFKDFDYWTKKFTVLREYVEIAEPWEAHEGQNADFCHKNHKIRISVWASSLIKIFKKFGKLHSFPNWNFWKNNANFECHWSLEGQKLASVGSFEICFGSILELIFDFFHVNCRLSKFRRHLNFCFFLRREFLLPRRAASIIPDD